MNKKQIYLGIAGVNSHDSAAALIINGDIIAAAEEERFTRVKHTGSFPYHSIEYCLREAGITQNDVDCVAYFMNPKLRLIPTLKFNVATAYSRFIHILNHQGIQGVINSAQKAWEVEQAIVIGHRLTKDYARKYENAKFVAVDHHDAHAASAFYASPFQNSSVLTVDLVGEWDTTRFYKGNGNTIEKMASIQFPHSLGKLYQMFTKFLGFAPNSDEYKVMGLAAYGTNRLVNYFERLYSLTPDGLFKLNNDKLLFCKGIRPEWDERIVDELGQPRQKDDQLTQNHKDIAFALQHSAEQILLHLVKNVVQRSGDRKICIAGGVALNALANQRIRESGLVDEIFIQPASHDAGTAIGAALHCFFHDNPNAERHEMTTSYLGPKYSNTELELVVENSPFVKTEGNQAIKQTIDSLITGKVVGLFQGRMEFGPRALGNRSILADPRTAEMKEKMNAKVKFREDFRPFAPVVLEERVRDYFALGINSPFMTQTFTATDRAWKEIPATIHQDGTARIQTVSKVSNPLLYKIIQLFETETGVPVLMNTSFNVAGEPIVCSPKDALNTFTHSGIDCLLMEDIFLTK